MAALAFGALASFALTGRRDSITRAGQDRDAPVAPCYLWPALGNCRMTDPTHRYRRRRSHAHFFHLFGRVRVISAPW